MKVTAYLALSVDGFIAREDGDIAWLHDPRHVDEGEDYGFASFIQAVDVMVMGRHTFDKVMSFENWPYGELKVVVLSRKGVAVPSALQATVSVRALEIPALTRALETEGYRHIYADGGQVVQGFLQAGLVTDLILTRIPRLLGKGIPLFGPMASDTFLKHQATRAFPGGMVQSHYQVIAPSP